MSNREMQEFEEESEFSDDELLRGAASGDTDFDDFAEDFDD
jgi:hypothetical protein